MSATSPRLVLVVVLTVLAAVLAIAGALAVTLLLRSDPDGYGLPEHASPDSNDAEWSGLDSESDPETADNSNPEYVLKNLLHRYANAPGYTELTLYWLLDPIAPEGARAAYVSRAFVQPRLARYRYEGMLVDSHPLIRAWKNVIVVGNHDTHVIHERFTESDTIESNDIMEVLERAFPILVASPGPYLALAQPHQHSIQYRLKHISRDPDSIVRPRTHSGPRELHRHRFKHTGTDTEFVAWIDEHDWSIWGTEFALGDLLVVATIEPVFEVVPDEHLAAMLPDHIPSLEELAVDLAADVVPIQ